MTSFDVPKVLDRLGLQHERRGKSLWSCCPYHQERTPSWSIVDDEGGERHGFHRCHGCGAGGGLLGLVAQVLGVDVETRDGKRAAREWLGDESVSAGHGLASPRLDRTSRSRLLVSRFEFPSGTSFAPVAEWPDAPRKYLLEKRGISAESVERWGLGYALEGRLRGRVVVPVRDSAGRPTSYTARAWGEHPRKYLEPRSEEGADKSAVFGEERWPPVEERDLVFVTEGGFDAIAVDECLGGAFVAGVYGSELLPGHVRRLATFRRVAIVTDPDPAGDKLARRLDEVLSRRAAAFRVDVPEGWDVADMQQKRPVVLRDMLIHAVFMTRRIVDDSRAL